MVESFTAHTAEYLKEQAGLGRKQQVYNGELGIKLHSSFGAGSNFPLDAPTVILFSLSGLHPNHETVTNIFRGFNLRVNVSYTISQTWQTPGGATVFNYISTYNVPGSPGQTYEVWTASWIGWVPSEININGTWHVITTVTGGASFFKNQVFTISGLSSYASFQLGTAAKGKIWDEGGGIAFVDFDGIKHLIPTTSILSASGAEDGQIWIDTSLGSGRAKLALIHGGLQRRTNRTSLPDNFFTTSATPGYIWCDSTRRGCLNFIYSDGKRYAMSDGTFGDL